MAPNTVVVALERQEKISLIEVNNNNNNKKSPFQEKLKTSTPKQLSWFLLLKARKLISFFPRAGMNLFVLLGSIKTRVSHSGDPGLRGSKLYTLIRAFLCISILALLIEIFAYYNIWDLKKTKTWEVGDDLVRLSYVAWMSLKGKYVAPLMAVMSRYCMLLFMVQSVDRVVQCVGWFWMKLRNLKPVMKKKMMKKEEEDDDDELRFYPMVLVQIPMCNEKEVI